MQNLKLGLNIEMLLGPVFNSFCSLTNFSRLVIEFYAFSSTETAYKIKIDYNNTIQDGRIIPPFPWMQIISQYMILYYTTFLVSVINQIKYTTNNRIIHYKLNKVEYLSR